MVGALMETCPVCGAQNPPCPLFPDWSDADRMEYLVSAGDAPDKQAFWRRAVKHLCSEAGVALLDQETLSSKLCYKGAQPMTLQQALGALHQEGDLIVQAGAVARSTGAAGSVSATVSWILRGLFVYPVAAAAQLLLGDYDDNAAESYEAAQVLAVHCSQFTDLERVVLLPDQARLAGTAAAQECTFLGVCEGAARAGNEKGHGRSNMDMAAHSLLHRISAPGAGDGSSHAWQELWLLVGHLEERGIAVRDGLLLKFCTSTPSTAPSNAQRHTPVPSRSSKAAMPQVTQCDKDTLQLRVTVSVLNRRLDQAQEQARKHKAAALVAKKGGDTQRAVLELRRSHLHAALADKARSALLLLEAALAKLEEMMVHKEVLQAQQAAAAALKALREEHGLTVERVEATADALESEMQLSDEVSQAMQQLHNGVAEGMGWDDADLEAELAQLTLLDGTQPPHQATGIAQQAHELPPSTRQSSQALSTEALLRQPWPQAPPTAPVLANGDDDKRARNGRALMSAQA
eukprot:TRINITY_DN1126_c0_g1_i1.p1 TRINITY_DN1126_c0_g1~~TRINITY_DN1126_c0_g1_i1.p1  ORF type:complete len:518 (-),score=78.50 TRINITY_DN1126_c0_g1_i1:145-1698(-)